MAKTGAGAKAYVSTTSVTNAVDSLGEYAVLTYTRITGVTELGEFGDARELVNHVDLDDSRVQKLGGPRDAGTMPLTCAWDPIDPGQLLALSHSETDFEYAWKIDLNDAPSASYSNTILFFRGPVTAQRLNNGNASSVRTINFNIPINSPITRVIANLSS
jgi:hypothetical protein